MAELATGSHATIHAKTGFFSQVKLWRIGMYVALILLSLCCYLPIGRRIVVLLGCRVRLAAMGLPRVHQSGGHEQSEC